MVRFNAAYARTGALVEGFPSYSAGPKKHLYRHPGLDKWHLSDTPFDPAETGCRASIPAAGGPVPTGARAWEVFAGGEWVTAEVAAREVAL
jgi:hypothetical protein